MKLSIKVGGRHSQDQDSDLVSDQYVNFLYLFGNEDNNSDDGKREYSDLTEEHPKSIIFAINYKADIDHGLTNELGFTNENVNLFSSFYIEKREIWKNESSEGGQEIYSPVVFGSSYSIIEDYNLKNNRQYEYAIYYSKNGQDSKNIFIYPISTSWTGWTLTELYETSNPKIYNASKDNVWKFKYNLSTGETQQEFSKTQQENLSTYPKFSIGPKRTLNGNVTCLLGRDVIPYNFITKKYRYIYNSALHKWEWVLNPISSGRGYNAGGYIEKSVSPQEISNTSIDMLNKWRDFCYSGNPKLLKDQKGDSYIVQITSSSNQTNESWEKMPENISFSWVKIGDANDYQIINEG